MNAIVMPRKGRRIYIDERVVAALEGKSDDLGKSFSGLCDEILFAYAKSAGLIPIDSEPIGESRGGKRSGAGRPKPEADQQR